MNPVTHAAFLDELEKIAARSFAKAMPRPTTAAAVPAALNKIQATGQQVYRSTAKQKGVEGFENVALRTGAHLNKGMPAGEAHPLYSADHPPELAGDGLHGTVYDQGRQLHEEAQFFNHPTPTARVLGPKSRPVVQKDPFPQVEAHPDPFQGNAYEHSLRQQFPGGVPMGHRVDFARLVQR